MRAPISITAIGSVSPLGMKQKEIWKNYLLESHHFQKRNFQEIFCYIADLKENTRQKVAELRDSEKKYKELDDSVLFAILASRIAIQNAAWKASDNFGVNIGSSRGATRLFEKNHEHFLQYKHAQTLSSPTTTLGNISSWVAHDLQTQGPEISHSITCSTALHALINGVAWMRAGMADKFLVGGSEAPLTPFTLAQIHALHIYAKKKTTYPCLAMNLEKKTNTMILGEGAAVICLEKGNAPNALAKISGVGYATELLSHSTSISTEADCFQKSMHMALGEMPPEEIDVVVMHAPGTIKGDMAEYNAIKKVFNNKIPALTTNKWKIGHTLGASGMLSVELAIGMLQHQQFIPIPFIKNKAPKRIKNIVVNAVGFGGNAVSILLSKH